MKEVYVRRQSDLLPSQIRTVRPFSKTLGKYGGMVQGLLSLNRTQVLLSCGNMLRQLKLSGHLLNGDGAELMKKELMSNLNEAKPFLSAKDFCCIGSKKETALVEVVELLAEMNSNSLLRDIAIGCDNEKVSNHATWALARAKDTTSLAAVFDTALTGSSRTIALRAMEK
ncbi:MAG: hypothetical protein V1492_04520 [Candidatus Micrarchaeota archaeon]